MISLRGKIQKGKGESQNTLREQMPYFKECFPEVSECRPATINILLEKPLVVITPDFTTQPLPWHPAFKVIKGGETFQFVRVNLAVDGCQLVKAWIYKAQFSPYRENPFYAEILSPFIDFKGTPACSLEIMSKSHEGIIVIGAARRDQTPKSVPR